MDSKRSIRFSRTVCRSGGENVRSQVNACLTEKKRPVVIPRVAIHGLLSTPLPFLRAYSPDLQVHDVPVEEFIAFIDNLAVVETVPAPLRALNIAGTAIGFVWVIESPLLARPPTKWSRPWHWALIAGLTINGVAVAGSKVITHTRTKRYMEIVNQEYFGPRGLKVSLCNDKELAALIGYPQTQPDLVWVVSYPL